MAIQNPPVIKVQSVAGRTGAVTLNKSDVGLDNVDNTADADKPLATSSSPGLMSAAQYSKLAALPSSFNAALLSSKLAFWDGLSDPTVSGNSYPAGAAYAGNAAWDSTETAVRLTAAVNNQVGGLEWSFSQLSFEYATFKFKAGGGNGADSTYFYCYADATPSTEEGIGITAGYIIGFSEFQSRITLYWATTKLAEVAQANIADGTWKTIKIFIIDNRVVVYYEGSLVIDYRDVHGRDVSNTRFGFGARTGGSNNNHWIKGLSVEKYIYGCGGITLTEF